VDLAIQTYTVPISLERGATIGATGVGFENLIAITNQGYANRYYGVVTKNHVREHHREKQTVDFCGYLVDVGFVAFDAKSTSRPRFAVRDSELHQFIYLWNGQRTLDYKLGRFFYLVEHMIRGVGRKVYLVEDLGGIYSRGFYEFNDADIVADGPGAPCDYRRKLLGVI
jgi:hypothetical protein